MDSQKDSLNRKAREVFDQLCDKPRHEWPAYLDKVCLDDSDLRSEVESLLEQDQIDRDWLERLEEEVIRSELHTLQSDQASLNAWMDGHFKSAEPAVDPEQCESFGDYELQEVIGHGGMGIVYKAEDTRLKRKVAIKFLPWALNSHKDAKERFMNEARAVSGVDHPNIATIHEVGETENGRMYIVMAYYQGDTLKTLIEKGPMEESRTLDLMIQLAGALQEIHNHGVIHRDIKPGNLLVTEEGVLKLLDFGLAKLAYASGVTQVGQFMGTVAYTSPEQIRAERVDARTDIWALGVVLFECLTGRPPFKAEEIHSAIHAILNDDLERPAGEAGGISDSLMHIIERCVAKNPDDRYESAAELLEDLQLVRDGQELGSDSGSWFSRFKNQLLYPKTVPVAIFLACVVAAPLLISFALKGGMNSPYSFSSMTEGVLVEKQGYFMGCSWADFDKDGWLDVVVTEHNRDSGTIHLYQNTGDGTFRPSNENVTSNESLPVGDGYWADPDNDGDLDLLLTTDNAQPTLLYYNDGQGRFSKASDQAWLMEPSSAHAAAWGDYDNDGWLDLLIASVSEIERESCKLYRNRGDGTMEETSAAFTQMPRDSHGCFWTDYDNDGDLDLFISGMEQVQFRNNGNGSFEWIGPDKNGLSEYTKDIDVGVASADYDNDGDLDLSYIVWGSTTGVLLYRNELSHSMNDVSHLLPGGEPIRGMSVAWGDYDNDGWIDLFVTNSLGKNRLYHNEGNDTFTVVEGSPLSARSLQACGTQWADFDNDGDLDLMVANGVWANFEQSCEMFINSGGPNHWLLVNLEGTLSNKAGIGAKVWVKATISGGELTQLREVSSGGNGGTGSGLRAHFGLGDATTVDFLRIEWPSGIIQELHDVPVDQILLVREEET